MRLLIRFKNSIEAIPLGVWAIFLIGLLIRLSGIWHGLPLPLNVDEPAMVSSVLALRYNINPGHFDWPHLLYYINAPFYLVFGVIREVIEKFYTVPEILQSPSMYFLISRLISAVFGGLTIIFIYVLGREMFGKRVGVLAALILALLPIHVFESHFAKTDIAQTFFTTISLIFIYRVYKTGLRKNFVLAGIFIGLTSSVKYGGILLFFPLLIAYLMSKPWQKWVNKQDMVNFVFAGIASFLAFIVTTPFALFDYKKFFSTERGVGAVWQIQNVGSLTIDRFPAELYETFIPMYKENLGLLLWGLFLLLIFLFLFFNKRKSEYVLLLLPTVLFSIYISRFDRSPDHYFVFLIPFYVTALAAFIWEIIEWISDKILFLKKKYNFELSTKFIDKYLPLLLIVLFLAPSLKSVINMDLLFWRSDTRNLAHKWVKSNLTDESQFLYVIGDDFETVPFRINESKRLKRLDVSSIEEPTPFYLIIGIEGLTKEELTTGNRDPKSLSGNSEDILKDAELVFEAQNTLRNGPPIYIFRVNSITED